MRIEGESAVTSGRCGYARYYSVRFGWTLAVVVLFADLICPATPPPGGSPPSDEKRAIAARSTLSGVPNFGQVSPQLYRGAQPTREGFSKLRKLGIDIVVDLRGSRESERKIVTGLGMKYVAIPWHCYSPRDEYFASFLTLLRENPDKKVFVHCRLGDDRTGMEIAAYRMAEQNWTADEAAEEMELFGANWFHRAICPRLRPYEQEFPQRFKTSRAFRDLRSDTPEPAKH